MNESCRNSLLFASVAKLHALVDLTITIPAWDGLYLPRTLTRLCILAQTGYLTHQVNDVGHYWRDQQHRRQLDPVREAYAVRRVLASLPLLRTLCVPIGPRLPPFYSKAELDWKRIGDGSCHTYIDGILEAKTCTSLTLHPCGVRGRQIIDSSKFNGATPCDQLTHLRLHDLQIDPTRLFPHLSLHYG
jgi:hypothetical protein